VFKVYLFISPLCQDVNLSLSRKFTIFSGTYDVFQVHLFEYEKKEVNDGGNNWRETTFNAHSANSHALKHFSGRVPFPIPRLRTWLDYACFDRIFATARSTRSRLSGPLNLCRVTIRLVALRQVHRSVVPPLAAAAALFVCVAADLCASKTIQRSARRDSRATCSTCSAPRYIHR